MKTLTSVNFSPDPNSKDQKHTCPACSKALSNSTKGVLAVPCGHVLCKPCADKFLKSDDPDPHNPKSEHGVVRCYVCEEDLTSKPKSGDKKSSKKDKVKRGLVQLRSDGTGFAGGGKAMVEKDGLAFKV
jgi:nitric oxide synthase-interacting protein